MVGPGRHLASLCHWISAKTCWTITEEERWPYRVFLFYFASIC